MWCGVIGVKRCPSNARSTRGHTSSSSQYGAVPAPGELFCNKPLAALYKRILREAAAASTGAANRTAEINAAMLVWAEGFAAREIDRFYRDEQIMDCSGERNRGLLRFEDMAGWFAQWEAPVTLEFGETTVAKCGPWSQGPVYLQQLALLKHASLESCEPDSAAFVHRVTEAAKLCMADRLAWYGDPAYVDVPLAHLLSDAYARERVP